MGITLFFLNVWTIRASSSVSSDGGDLSELARFEPLDLAVFLERVLEENLLIAAEREARAIAAERARMELGLFEPRWVSGATREYINRDNTNQQMLSMGRTFFEERSTVGESALETRLPTGAQVRTGGQVRRIRNNLGFTDRPEYVTTAGVSVTQPLLRDAGLRVNLARLRAARSDSEASFQEMRRQIMSSLSQAESAYWGLYEALHEYRLRRESVRVAEQILEDNRARVEAGRMTEIDVLQARAALAIRRTQMEGAAEQVRDIVSVVYAFLGEVLDEEMAFPYPADDPNLDPPLRETHARVTQARTFHPGYLQLAAELESSTHRRDLARNQRLPELNFRGDWGLSGYGNTLGGSGDTLIEPGTRNWFVGVEMSIPVLGGIRERGIKRIGEREWRQASLALLAVEVELGNRLRALGGRVDSLAGQVASYEEVVAFNEAVLENELASLEVGRGDSRRVFEAEEDLTRARLAVLESRVRFQRGQIDLSVTTGTYLLDKGLDPSEP